MAELKKYFNLFTLTFYGVGVILGAGIYVIITEVALSSGSQFPLSFVLAALIATFAGLSYAELSSRFPEAGGEAVYVNEAFHNKRLNIFIGYAVILTGTVSSATIVRGFHRYLESFVHTPLWLTTGVVVIVLTALAIKGIKESVRLVTIVTCLEIAGLLLVIGVGGSQVFENSEAVLGMFKEDFNLNIMQGAFIAFFAFVGFEDIVNSAEEVKNPTKTVPRAIILAIIISTLLYFIVSLVCLASLTMEEISSGVSPLVQVVSKHSSLSPKIMGVIGLFAIINGALVQIIMISRMLFGMAKLGGAPKSLAIISERTQTPIYASLVAGGSILLLAFLFPIDKLAQYTSLIILIVFCGISLALIKIKKEHGSKKGIYQVPLFVPISTLIICLVFIFIFLSR